MILPNPLSFIGLILVERSVLLLKFWSQHSVIVMKLGITYLRYQVRALTDLANNIYRESGTKDVSFKADYSLFILSPLF